MFIAMYKVIIIFLRTLIKKKKNNYFYAKNIYILYVLVAIYLQHLKSGAELERNIFSAKLYA